MIKKNRTQSPTDSKTHRIFGKEGWRFKKGTQLNERDKNYGEKLNLETLSLLRQQKNPRIISNL